MGERMPVAWVGAPAIACSTPFAPPSGPDGVLRARVGPPATVLLRGVLTFGFTGAEAFVPLMLVSLRGMSAAQAGLSLTAATLTWAMGAWEQARRVGAWGAGLLIRLGLGLVVLGIA